MSHRNKIFLFLVVLLPGFLFVSQPVSAKDPIVRALLFFSPTCPHCHKVMVEDLPPLKEKYGKQLQIAEIDVTQDSGKKLYQAAVDTLQIKQLGVPTMVVGQSVLIGSQEIPIKLPGLIETGLQAGGVAWPVLPDLELTLAKQGLNEPVKNQNDAGIYLAWVVLVGMVLSLLVTGFLLFRGSTSFLSRLPMWIMPILIVIGVGVAAYLTLVETTNTQVVCGPIPGCGTVQNSSYAKLFGIVPVGIVGIAGYLAVIITWLVQYFGPKKIKILAVYAVWGMALFGVLFSIYLTILEIFVIHAACIWCLTSAVVMTLVLWVATGPLGEVLKFEEEEEDPEEGPTEA